MNSSTIPLIENPHIDKKGADLDRQRFKMLEDIARDLSGEVVFPTCFDTVMRLRQALNDPAMPLERLAALITLEPLISARLIALANSVAYNPGGTEIRGVQRAIERLGLKNVRSVSLAIAMKQLIMARQVVGFQMQAEQLWKHSLRTASAACVVARRLTRTNPEDALLAGMVHDIGAFYMIYRAAQYEELMLRPDTTKHLIIRWHESIGHALIVALGLPAEIADATIDHDHPRPITLPPRNLADIIYLANRLADPGIETIDLPGNAGLANKDTLRELSNQLGGEIDVHEASLKSAFN